MALSGGSGDKVGNEYEVWWTLRRITQLLRGDLDLVALEPLGADGAELWVEASGKRTFDQVKYRSSGQWTPSRLRSDGLLAKLTRHYMAGHEIALILSQPSDELERLIDLARATHSGDELWSATSDPNGLELLRDTWGATRDETRHYLLQTSVRHDGMTHLREYVELALDTLVVGGAQAAVGALRAFLDSRLNQEFSAPHVWQSLREAGLAERPRLQPGPTAARMRSALDRYLRAVERSSPATGTIDRHEVFEILDALQGAAAPVVLVSGIAGSGKSVVVADVAERLARSGRHVAAVRLDRLSPSTTTAEKLGAALDLNASPVVALSDISPSGFDGVLVIDQLDAISSYSGRMPDVYEAVDEALTQARLLGNVQVVLAVRAIDLAEDPRLRKLAGEDSRTVEVGELDGDEVRSFLAEIGTDPGSVSAVTLELLKLPIYLYVFSELDPSARLTPYVTLSSLYDEFTRSFRTRLERQGHPDEWREVSRTLIDRMNAEEVLAVRQSVLDHIRPLYVEALISSNVLIEDDGRLSLLHETYFDHLFAKSFEPRAEGLIRWFSDSGQGLFRRSQLRQLLSYIAAEERSSFTDHVLAIANSDLRPHLRSIAHSALASIVPTTKEWLAVRTLVSPTNTLGGRVIALLASPAWFQVADDEGDVEKLLDADAGESIAAIVARLSENFPERILELLAPRARRGPEWVRSLRMAIELSDSPQMLDFAIGQLDSGLLDLPDDAFDVLGSSLMYRMMESRPAEAMRCIVASLEHQVSKAVASDADSLTEVFDQRGRHSVSSEKLEQLAADLGAAFVTMALSLVEKVATFSATGRPIWRYRFKGGNHSFGDRFFATYDEALTAFARADPDGARPVLRRLSSHGAEPLDFLVCRALHELDADTAVDWLLESEDHLALGWISDPRWESRRLIANATGNCSADRVAALETKILYMHPDTVSPEGNLRWRGHAELQLLSAISAVRLSARGGQRLAELKRKFPMWSPSEPEGISGGFVGPPINKASALRMTDANWLRAIEKYGDRRATSFRDGQAIGGSDELATLLGALAKEDPQRFIALALQLPPDTPGSYTDHILRNVSPLVEQPQVVELLRKYRREHPDESGRASVAAIDAHVPDLDDDLFAELLQLCEDRDPIREYARVSAGSDNYYGGDFISAGINSARGSAATTLARVIFGDSSRLPQSIESIHQLAADPIIAVRALATEPVLAYASEKRADGLSVLQQLLSDDDVLSTSSAQRALRWAMLWDAERFAPYLERALDGPAAKEAGAHWANCLLNDALGSAPADVRKLPSQARLGAAEAVAHAPALATDLVARLFDDSDPEVRREAARGLHFVGDAPASARNRIVSDFVGSAAFPAEANELFEALEDVQGELPSIGLEACRRVVESIEYEPRKPGVTALSGNLITVLVRIYRAADSVSRDAALDLIDRTILLDLWRVDQTLDSAR